MSICSRCGGSVLTPTRTGAKRGTCHCPKNLVGVLTKDEIREANLILGKIFPTDEEASRIIELSRKVAR